MLIIMFLYFKCHQFILNVYLAVVNWYHGWKWPSQLHEDFRVAEWLWSSLAWNVIAFHRPTASSSSISCVGHNTHWLDYNVDYLLSLLGTCPKHSCFWPLLTPAEWRSPKECVFCVEFCNWGATHQETQMSQRAISVIESGIHLFMCCNVSRWTCKGGCVGIMCHLGSPPD